MSNRTNNNCFLSRSHYFIGGCFAGHDRVRRTVLASCSPILCGLFGLHRRTPGITAGVIRNAESSSVLVRILDSILRLQPGGGQWAILSRPFLDMSLCQSSTFTIDAWFHDTRRIFSVFSRINYALFSTAFEQTGRHMCHYCSYNAARLDACNTQLLSSRAVY